MCSNSLRRSSIQNYRSCLKWISSSTKSTYRSSIWKSSIKNSIVAIVPARRGRTQILYRVCTCYKHTTTISLRSSTVPSYRFSLLLNHRPTHCLLRRRNTFAFKERFIEFNTRLIFERTFYQVFEFIPLA